MQTILWISALVTALAPAAADNDLEGRVVDERGRPIARVRAFIYTAKPRVGVGIVCPSAYADCTKEAATDAVGEFRVEALDPSLLFQVLFLAEGYRPKFAEDVDPMAEPLAIELQREPEGLDPRNVLRGTVTDKRGEPIVGAVVEPFGIKTADRHWYGRMPGVDPLALTNAQGEFLVFSEQPDVALHIKVSASQHPTAVFDLLPTGEKVHQLQLGDGVQLTGRLMDGDKPVAGATVGLVQIDRGASSFVGEYTIGSDAGGRFTFDSVVPDTDYYIYTKTQNAVGTGSLPIRRVTVGEDGSSHALGELPMEPTHRLAGRVTLTDGKPIPEGTQLMVSREYAWDFRNVVLQRDGTFSLECVPKGVFKIRTRIAGYRLASRQMPFQQMGSQAFGLYFDADRTDLQIFLEPEP